MGRRRTSRDKGTARKLRFSRLQAIVAIAIAIFLASFLVGMRYGRITSPRAETEDAVIVYLANHTKFLDIGDDVILTLDVQAFSYRYTLSTNVVSRERRPINELMTFHLPERHDDAEYQAANDLFKLLAPAAAGASTVGIWATINSYPEKADKATRPITAPERILTYVVVGIVAVTGGYVGYLVTHDDTITFDPAVVRKALDDPVNWGPFARTVRVCEVSKKADDVLKKLNPDRADFSSLVDGCRSFVGRITSR